MRKRGKKGLADRVTDTVTDRAADLADTVIPAIESVVETVQEKAVPILEDGRRLATKSRRRAAAKAAAFAEAAPSDKLSALVHAEPAPEKKGGKLKKLLLLGVLVALGGAVAKKLQGGKAQGNWQSSYTPSPAPRHAAAATATSTTPAAADEADEPAAADDAAGASPGEALADRAEEPHPDTTPDEPAEVVELASVADTDTDAETTDEAPATGSPYGEGSALPLPDGSAPGAAYTIKGNKKSMLFHTSQSPSFEQTRAEVWFTNEVAAEAAGFRHWKSTKD